MKSDLKKILGASVVSITYVSSASFAATIISEDFSSGTAGTSFRIYESDIDQGWHKGSPSYGSVVESAWEITGGQVQNASVVRLN